MELLSITQEGDEGVFVSIVLFYPVVSEHGLINASKVV
jgi:hypothetical protein